MLRHGAEPNGTTTLGSRRLESYVSLEYGINGLVVERGGRSLGQRQGGQRRGPQGNAYVQVHYEG